MLKCEVQFDNEKIIRDDIYTPESVRKATDEMFVDEFDLVKGENGFYYQKGSDEDYVHFMSAILSLKRLDWFMKYASKWLWFENDQDGDYGDFYVEDLLSGFRALNKGRINYD